MKKLFVILLLFTATSYASEVAKLSIGGNTLELPYLELVYPHEAYTAVLTSTDGVHFSVDYSTVKQLPLNPNVDKTKLVQLSISEDGWFLELPYIEKDLHFSKEIYRASFYSTTGGIFVTEGVIPISKLVKKAYCSFLDREADESGLNNFVNLMTNEGWTAKQLVQALVSSEEFKQNFFDTKSTTEYVTYIYNLLLQREPDPDGLTSWMNMVEQQGWSIIIEEFLNSGEYIQNFGDDSIPTKDGC